MLGQLLDEVSKAASPELLLVLSESSLVSDVSDDPDCVVSLPLDSDSDER